MHRGDVDAKYIYSYTSRQLTLSFLWYSLRAGRGPYSMGIRRVRRALGTLT